VKGRKPKEDRKGISAEESALLRFLDAAADS
jgi:hypothetical protein